MLLSEAKKDGVVTNLIICRCIIGESNSILSASILALYCSAFAIALKITSFLHDLYLYSYPPHLELYYLETIVTSCDEHKYIEK